MKQIVLQKSNPKSRAELLHVIQNLILSGVANIQRQTFYVVACSLEFSYAHQDEADINQHILTKTHQNKASSLGQQPTLTFVPQNVQSTV